MKAINFLINSYLPEDLKNDDMVLDKKGIFSLMQTIAKLHPDKYRDISKKISDTGRMASYLQGETLTLQDMRTPIDKAPIFAQMDADVAKMQKTTAPKERLLKKLQIYSKYADIIRGQTTQAMMATPDHGLANTVYSGAKGNPTQLNSMIATPAMFTDYKDKPIPIFVRRSFGEGLRPYEYLASMYGARKSVIASKEATRDAGDLGKQLAQAAVAQIVTQHKCSCSNGIMVPVDNIADSMGRITARDYKGIPAGTPITAKVLSAFSKQKVAKVFVRSPMTCKASAGVCSEAAGTLSNGKLPDMGASVGMTAAQALGEPLAQGSLNTKHTGGVYSGKKSFSGFSVINQLMQSPTTFPNKAAVAEVAGRVQKIEEAPQGGYYVHIDGERHYTLPGFELSVKEGDIVEAGEQLSDGIVDVKDIINFRGLGAGRKYYVDRLEQAYKDSGMPVSRRNLEYLARSALDHVRVESLDGMGEYLPDDIVSYNELVNTYQPPASAKMALTENSVNKYLEVPALHYTIGTKITPKIKKDLIEGDIKQIYTSEKAPEFTPIMTYLRRSNRYSQDWMAKLHTSYIADTLKTDAFRGADTNIERNIHFAPRIAIGKGFGDKIENTGQF